ncbi:MAG: type IV secretion protein [Betaproteobacteria bacterium]|nr:type IV secretion protein [Betaproteobacteria bacterium]
MDHNVPSKQSIWDDPVTMGLIFGGGIFGVLAVWHFGHDLIVKAYWNFRAIEFWVLHKVASIVDLPGFSTVRQWLDANCAPGAVLCQRADWSNMTWQDLARSSVAVNVFFALALLIICLRAYWYAISHHPIIRFAPRRVHTLETFLAENAALYPHLAMFNRLDLIGAPIDDPLIGMSQTSRQFAFANRLITGWAENADGTLAPTLDRERAKQVFRAQLGKLWIPRPSGLTPGETLLLAIVLPRVAATDPTMDDGTFQAAMKDSEDMLQWCWSQFTPPAKGKARGKGADISWLQPDIALDCPRETIRKYFKHPAVQALITKHAYVRTVLYAMFCEGRRLGVLPPSEMRWLRYFDRQLWYVLQNISSRTAAFVEGAAVVSHYLYEAKSDEAIVEPQLDRAIDALSTGMCSFRYGPEDKEEYEASLRPALGEGCSATGASK